MTPQALAVLVIMALLTAGAAVLFAVVPGLRQDQGVDEMQYLAAQTSRALFTIPNAGCNNMIVAGYLPKDVYDVDDDDACDATPNVFGGALTIVDSVTGARGGNGTITYTADTDEQCQYILAAIQLRFDAFNATPTCAANVLTAIVQPERG